MELRYFWILRTGPVWGCLLVKGAMLRALGSGARVATELVDELAQEILDLLIDGKK